MFYRYLKNVRPVLFVTAVILSTVSKTGYTNEQHSLKIGVNALPRSLEPINAISNVGPRIVDQIYDRLIVRDYFGGNANGTGINLVSSVAKEWERIDDKSVRFHL